MTEYNIPEAIGASIRPADLIKEMIFPITDFGASVTAAPADNTRAINAAIDAAAQKGGTVLIPEGTFYTYTILLQSNVNLCLEEGAVIAAAKTDITHFYAKQKGEGGNYEEPEVNPYAGIQDHGHSYFANSLVYGADLENIMIYGKGLFTGGRLEESGILEYVLQGGDPPEPSFRNQNGHAGEWFGNKGIALVRCKNIVLEDFSFTIGGHFAIITEGCENLYVDHVLIDTTRDAFDIDCCQDVTVRHTTCNSLTDDGLCLKASFGAGFFKSVQNVLIEDCIVSGYDAGSVYAGEYSRDKLIATDRCGPTGRVKFGTESTCGYHLVTIRRVKFDRSRGFCMEAVDCSSLTDVIFEDCELDNVSSSPIFLRAGDRARFPVTGMNASSEYPVSGSNVRLDNKNWILPNENSYHCYPVRRYSPCYNRTKTVTVDGHSFFEIIDGAAPVQCNPANYVEQDGHFFLNTWKGGNDTVQLLPASGSYEADLNQELTIADLPLYANGIGCSDLASVENVLIRNVTITNADPRYPILLMGLTDSHIKNVTLENISVEYRGGLSMEHAVEQRQLNTAWSYSQFHAKEQVQNLPWLVNTFFVKNEGLLPRMDWDKDLGCWREDAYNVPELPDVYPEPSNWGILPAYGIFAKHVDGLVLRNIKCSCKVPDGRHVCVFDDVKDISVDGLEAYCSKNIPPIAVVTDHYRRHTNAENVPEQPYFTTDVTGLDIVKPLVLHCDSPVVDENTHSSSYDRHAHPLTEGGPAQPTANDGRAQSLIDDTSAQSAINENPTHSPIIKNVEIQAPAPGTPQDSLYPYPTVPCRESGYHFAVDTDDYPLPLTVYRPFMQSIAPVYVKPGEVCSLILTVRNPASDISEEADNGMIYNEPSKCPNYSVKGREIPLTLSCETLPPGASFHPEQKKFLWTPTETQLGEHFITFTVDDGVIPEKMTVKISVTL